MSNKLKPELMEYAFRALAAKQSLANILSNLLHSGWPPEDVKALSRELNKWNWGACLWGTLWPLMHGMWWLGLILLITSFTPFNFLATGLGGAYLGMEGNKIALSRRKFKDLDQFYKVQRVWKIVGFIVTPLGLLYSFAYLSFMVSIFGGRFYNPLSDLTGLQFPSLLCRL